MQHRPTWRQRQAQATRRQIAGNAQDLFLAQGYATTTIEAIAERAGVAVSTVYSIFGSKRGILRAIREAWHEGSNIREVAYGTPVDSESLDRLTQLAEATRRQWETGSAILAIYKGAAAADPEAAAELASALAGRREGLHVFVDSIAPHLRPGLSVARATAIVRALSLPELYDELVTHAGWTPEEYEGWLLQALSRELLPSEQ